MPILSRRTVAALAALYCLLAAPGFAVPGHAAGDNSSVMRALRDGGLVIVVRHGATVPDQADTDPLNFDNIAAQRNLNDNLVENQAAAGTAGGEAAGKATTGATLRAEFFTRPATVSDSLAPRSCQKEMRSKDRRRPSSFAVAIGL